MNLLQLVQALHREVRRAGPAPLSVVDAAPEVQRLADYVRNAWRLLQREPYNWRWRLETADLSWPAGQTVSTPGAGLVDFGSWRPASRTYWPRCIAVGPAQPASPMAWRARDEMARMMDVPLQPGHPQLWSIGWRDELMVLPPASLDATIRIDYTRAEQELVDDADEPDMPKRHHMILVWRAMVDFGKASVAAEDVSRASDNLADMMAALIADQGEQISWAASPLA